MIAFFALSCSVAFVMAGTTDQEKMTLFKLKLPVYQNDSPVPVAILYADEAKPIGINFELKGVKLDWIGVSVSDVKGVVTTPSAVYDRSTNLISGNKWIKYRSKEMDLDGIGFDIDQAAQTIHLRSEVKVTIKSKMESNREKRIRSQQLAGKQKKSSIKLRLKPEMIPLIQNITGNGSSIPAEASTTVKTPKKNNPGRKNDSKIITICIRVVLVAAIVLFFSSWLYSRARQRKI
ncbi:MAG: hypothetical protein GXP32_05240 [Kiritimatiellaeota bacterium]|nr:hypothetical protein [Kiritimatiellota bacterium]